ncbi:hypothetical protein PG987_005301 [Apiospora arundinis]
MHRAIVELRLGIAPQIFGKNDLVELRGDVITNYATKPVRYATKPMRLVIIVFTVACHAAATMPLLDRKVKARGSTRSQIKEAYQAIWIEFDNACRRLVNVRGSTRQQIKEAYQAIWNEFENAYRRLYAQAAQVRRAKQCAKVESGPPASETDEPRGVLSKTTLRLEATTSGLCCLAGTATAAGKVRGHAGVPGRKVEAKETTEKYNLKNGICNFEEMHKECNLLRGRGPGAIGGQSPSTFTFECAVRKQRAK